MYIFILTTNLNLFYCTSGAAFISFLIQASMDLPPDKAKLLKNYDNEKKWDIICDQVSYIRYEIDE